jgi:hypothetical protein
MRHPFASLTVISQPPPDQTFVCLPPPQSHGNTAAYPKANESSSSHEPRETQITKNSLNLRLPISNHPRNSQKRRSLRRHL